MNEIYPPSLSSSPTRTPTPTTTTPSSKLPIPGQWEQQSTAFRANLAKLVSPLRRIRTHTPFFKLAAHRIPTLWQLYRGLLRTAPDEQIKFRVRLAFRQNRHMTGVEGAKEQLVLWYKRLSFFTQAAQGSAHHQNVLARYSRLILLRRERAQMTRLYLEDLDFLESRRNQPINTGSFIRPSLLNPPLPRLKPQPQATSMIFMKRRVARERRHSRREAFEEDLRDLEEEARFESGLMTGAVGGGGGGGGGGSRREFFNTRGGGGWEPVFCGEALNEWKRPINDAIDLIKTSQTREYARAAMPYSPELIQSVFAARREKHRNLSHALVRERRGEVLKRTLKRQRKGPPSWVLARMTEKQKDMDRVVRSVSEVGYVAMVKRRLGWKLKGDEDVRAEEGREENRAVLDLAMKVVREENRKRAEVERREIERAEREGKDKNTL